MRQERDTRLVFEFFLSDVLFKIVVYRETGLRFTEDLAFRACGLTRLGLLPKYLQIAKQFAVTTAHRAKCLR